MTVAARVIVAAALLSTLSSNASAAPSFMPYAGDTGYQEIRLSADSWYVAFHGGEGDRISVLEAGWRARAAQLCGKAGATHVVELRYVGERVRMTDPPLAAGPSDDPASRTPAAVIFIPIFSPQASGPPSILPVLTPSKQGAVRCLTTTDGLLSGKTALPVQSLIDAARREGLSANP